jgi:PDZ domain-containing protein
VKRALTPARLTLAGLALLLLVAVILWLVPSNSYLLLPDTARPVAPLVTVPKSRLTGDDKGEIFFLAVLVRKANLLERLFPSIRSGSTLVPESALRPAGVSEQTQLKIDERDMSQSQSIAAVVALRAMGYKVIARQEGAEIADVVPRSPAAGKLKPNDVIVSVDGHRVRTLSDLRRLIRRHRPGEIVRIGVRTSKGLHTVVLRTKAAQGHPVIGVIIGQNAADIKLPFPVKIRAGSVVGPSAGLAFALEIMEKLGRNVDRGYRVAATGELDLNGQVGPIGGVEQKTIEAKHSHVDILLIPGENAAEARKYAGSMRVIPVNSFQQALRKLATVPSKA